MSKVSFLEPDEEQNYTEKTLSALGEEVQRLLEEGVKLNDITILVRKNKNIPPIADYFDKELHLPLCRTKRSVWMPPLPSAC